MSRSRELARISPSDFDRFANDVAMAVWNRLAHLPQFGHLHPKDFPLLYETIHTELQRWGSRTPQHGRR